MRQIYDGAALECSLGSCRTALRVPIGHGCCLKGKNQATISDRKGNVNIMPFAVCKRGPSPTPCTPTILVDWINGQSDFLVMSEIALLNVCIVPCAFGGIIKIVD